eukprot:CAMPEP_0172179462 /NCGR_PEP_ID=MMETSP1050-20130122/16633_1 /TAXON_ID=233186 /ORGANISM="Cryptomonas curvata, Strain CCAP979/52" /LENGTH=150 /DNA_ID=CAMNT_0012852351 /DNA_START=74 /DNA_END=526 /DNA_ORIENTATION=-
MISQCKDPGTVHAFNTTHTEKVSVENSSSESSSCNSFLLKEDNNEKTQTLWNIAVAPIAMGGFENLTASSICDHLETNHLDMQHDAMLEKILHDIFKDDILSSVKPADPVRAVPKYFSDSPISMPSPRHFERKFSASKLGTGHRLSIDST